MTRIIVAIALIGTLTACGSRFNTDNLPVRNGPQTQDPYLPIERGGANATGANKTVFGVNNGGIFN